MSRLSVAGLEKRFGGLVALAGVGFSLEAGELVGLIGPNGSGKTTLLNLLSGLYRPERGRVDYDGAEVTRLDPHELARRGLARTFQVTKIFRRISVLENLLVPGLTDWGRSRRDAVARAEAVLHRLELEPLRHQAASGLSGGQGKLLEFGRLMMLAPRVVLLDEPFGGVHPTLKALMHRVIRQWHEEGVTVLLISHDMGSIFGLCHRVLVLHNGALIADGAAEAVRRQPEVVEAYLGHQQTRAV